MMCYKISSCLRPNLLVYSLKSCLKITFFKQELAKTSLKLI